MKRYYSNPLVFFLVLNYVCHFTLCKVAVSPLPSFRPPSLPIITYDPYMNIWANSDILYEKNTTLWDGQNKPLSGFIRVEGDTYRFLGNSTIFTGPTQTVTQLSFEVTPTKTFFEFSVEDSDVYFNVTFFTPILPTSLDLVSRPVTYLTLDVLSKTPKSVQLYVDVSGELACFNNHQPLVWSRQITQSGLNTMNIGNFNQTPFVNPVDKSSINWGYMYVSAPLDSDMQQCIGGLNDIRDHFYTFGILPSKDESDMPQTVGTNWIGLSVMWNVTGQITSSKTVMLAYDDVWSMDYFGTPMKPYYSYTFPGNFSNLLDKVWSEFSVVQEAADQFENQFFDNFTNVGGDEYATLCALSFRQVLAGCKAVLNPLNANTNSSSPDSPFWYFLKEISSAGDISTMDVIFPASPFFLYYNPYLLQSLLIPVLEYANNNTNIEYNLSWAPHALGKWPVCNIEPNQQEQMPIETTADLLLMLLGVAQRTNSTLPILQKNYWSLLQNYAFYLLGVLPDPPNQLCTDDFEGAIPHNANLALKGILALAAWSNLCKMVGDDEQADIFLRISLGFAKDWMLMANPNNSDHYRLRYDEEGWSLKYNLVWQNILGFNVFPQQVYDLELAFYTTQMLEYGVPLDSRSLLAKSDWQSWVAALNPNSFDSFFDPLYQFANFTPQRVPLTDFYWPNNGTRIGFEARPVLGAYWAYALQNNN